MLKSTGVSGTCRSHIVAIPPRRLIISCMVGYCQEKDDPFDVIKEGLDDWLTNLADEGDQNRLAQVAERIAGLMESDIQDN